MDFDLALMLTPVLLLGVSMGMPWQACAALQERSLQRLILCSMLVASTCPQVAAMAGLAGHMLVSLQPLSCNDSASQNWRCLHLVQRLA